MTKKSGSKKPSKMMLNILGHSICGVIAGFVGGITGNVFYGVLVGLVLGGGLGWIVSYAVE